MSDKLCGYPIDEEGTACGSPAVAVIKVREGKISLETKKGIARGVGSLWLNVCELHKDNYPDHEGFELDRQ